MEIESSEWFDGVEAFFDWIVRPITGIPHLTELEASITASITRRLGLVRSTVFYTAAPRTSDPVHLTAVILVSVIVSAAAVIKIRRTRKA
jgi:hypothetical protein